VPTIESDHPYSSGADETKSGTVTGAHHVFLSFNSSTNFAGGDTAYILDENNVSVFTYGFTGGQLASDKYSILGQTGKVKLVRPTGGAYGYLCIIDDASDVVGPYLIDTTNYQKWSGEATGYPGPYRYGGKIYAVFEDSTNQKMGIFKSTDGGVTFTKHADSPTDAANGYASQGSSATKIRICYDSVATNHKWVIGEWDMSNDTWTEITTYTDVVDTTGYSYDPVSGRDFVFYRPTVQGRMYVRTFNGTSWDGGLEVSDNLPTNYLTTIGAARADEDGDLHIVYRSTAPSPISYGIYYRQLKSNGTMTSAITILTGLTSARSIVGHLSFTGNCVVLPIRVDDPGAGGGLNLAAAILGHDYHDDSPTFDSPITMSVNNVQDIRSADGPNGLAYVWWIAIAGETLPPPEGDMDQVEYRSIACDGTLGSIVVFHNEVTYPSPINDISGQFLHDLAPPVWDSASQTWGVIVALEYNPLGTSDQWCTSFYWETTGGDVTTYYTDFAAWRSDGNTPNFTY